MLPSEITITSSSTRGIEVRLPAETRSDSIRPSALELPDSRRRPLEREKADEGIPPDQILCHPSSEEDSARWTSIVLTPCDWNGDIES